MASRRRLGVDQLIDVSRGLTILSEAAKLKTPGLADAVTRGISEHLTKELNAHLSDQLKGGGVVIVNAGA